MGRIQDDYRYKQDQEVSVLDYVVGTDFEDNKKTKSYSWLSVFEKFKEYTGFFCPFASDIDTNISFNFYGGTAINNDWLINRYDKTDVSIMLRATQNNNPFVTDMATAWANKETLNYS